MDKEFIRSDNYFVADTMNGEPCVLINNYVDDDGGFKIATRVDLGNCMVVFHKTVLRSIGKDGKEANVPDFEIEELDFLSGMLKRYKVVFKSEEEPDEELMAIYSERFKDPVGATNW